DFLVSVRPGGSVTGFAPEVNRSLLPLSANLIPPRIFSLEGSTTKSLAGLRMAIVLLGCFAGHGVVVAGVGVYATGTLMAAARRREMGIRVALGAQREQIQRLVLWRGLRSVLIAVPAGMLGAWGGGARAIALAVPGGSSRSDDLRCARGVRLRRTRRRRCGWRDRTRPVGCISKSMWRGC